MYPHERSLVKRLQHEPFALIGVNSDRDLEAVKPDLAREKITWRSFWDGPKGTQGPIAQSWGVQGWPTIHIIDAEGRFRYMNIRGEENIDKAIDTLLAEIKGQGGEKKPAEGGD